MCFFYEFWMSDSAGSPPLRRLGDWMLVALALTSQSIRELGARESSVRRKFCEDKTHSLGPRTQKKAKCVRRLLDLPTTCMDLCDFFAVWLERGAYKTDVSTLCGEWSALMVAQMELALPVFINWSTALCWSNSRTLTEVLGGPQHTQKTHISVQKTRQ